MLLKIFHSLFAFYLFAFVPIILIQVTEQLILGLIGYAESNFHYFDDK